MPDRFGSIDDRDEPTALDLRLRSVEVDRAPPDLLGRCLATIPADTVRIRRRRRRVLGRKGRLATAAAAVLFAIALGLLSRSEPADAAQVLKEAHEAWTRVPAAHAVATRRGPSESRTEEAWFVRDKGQRKEVRIGSELIGVVVNDRRWEFRWDVRERLVAAWAAPLIDASAEPLDSGLVTDAEALVAWAEAHKGEVHMRQEKLGNREVRSVRLVWPGPDNPGTMSRSDMFWFDRDSLLPLRHRSEFGDGSVVETTIDYPSAGAVPDDLFQFRPAADVLLEINDPDLGRQIYSKGNAAAHSTERAQSKGAPQ